jgi:DNA processing protein
MFAINNLTKREALNFATLMNVLECTESKLEPIFDEFGENVDVTIPLDDQNTLGEYSDYFHVDSHKLLNEYEKTKKAFDCLAEQDEIIKRNSDLYPPLLAQTKQAPRFLYLRGNVSLLYEKRAVALVGTRNASAEAREMTKQLTTLLGKYGIVIVSGLAKGIDVTAHVAALDNGLHTIAVIGTHLNQYYPSENKKVQLKIEEKGLVVSQFPPSLPTQRWFFPVRNGVMSGLSLATVIMEAGETSGALKQADYALKQERQILIPDSAIRDQRITWPARYVERGAKIFYTPQDVIMSLAEDRILNDQDEETPVQLTFDSYLSERDKKNIEISCFEQELIVVCGAN